MSDKCGDSQSDSIANRLAMLSRLYERDVLEDKQKILKIERGICKEYRGPGHEEIHAALQSYLPNGDPRVVADFLCILPVECEDSLQLRVSMIAVFLESAEWDGNGLLDDVPKLSNPEYSHVYMGLTNALMDAGNTPRKLLDSLRSMLAGKDRRLVLAALVYIRGWLSSAPEGANLHEFFPDLEVLVEQTDSSMLSVVRTIREDAEYLRREGISW